MIIKRGFEFWLNKHIGYAKREAVDMLFIEYGFTSKNKTLKNSFEAKKKEILKKNFIVSFLYFYAHFFISCIGILFVWDLLTVDMGSLTIFYMLCGID